MTAFGKLTAREASAVRVAIRMASATFTELVSMSAGDGSSLPLMDLIRDLASADKKLR